MLSKLCFVPRFAVHVACHFLMFSSWFILSFVPFCWGYYAARCWVNCKKGVRWKGKDISRNFHCHSCFLVDWGTSNTLYTFTSIWVYFLWNPLVYIILHFLCYIKQGIHISSAFLISSIILFAYPSKTTFVTQFLTEFYCSPQSLDFSNHRYMTCFCFIRFTHFSSKPSLFITASK